MKLSPELEAELRALALDVGPKLAKLAVKEGVRHVGRSEVMKGSAGGRKIAAVLDLFCEKLGELASEDDDT